MKGIEVRARNGTLESSGMDALSIRWGQIPWQLNEECARGCAGLYRANASKWAGVKPGRTFDKLNTERRSLQALARGIRGNEELAS